MLDSLDTLIAFVLIMLVVSLLITIGVQMIGAVLNLRGLNLLNGMATTFKLIAPDVGQNASELARCVLKGRLVSDSFLPDWPIIRWWRHTTAMRSTEVFDAIHRIAIGRKQNVSQTVVQNARALLVALGVDEATLNNAASKITAAQATAKTFVDSASKSLESLLPDDALRTKVQATVQTALDDTKAKLASSGIAAADATIAAAGNIDAAYQKFQYWTDICQERVQQWFAMYTRVITGILAFVFAFWLQLDTVEIFKLVSSNKTIRDKLVAQSAAVTSQADKVLRDSKSVLQKAYDAWPSKSDPAVQSALASASIKIEPNDTREKLTGRIKDALASVPAKDAHLKSFNDTIDKTALDMLKEQAGDYAAVKADLDNTGFDIFPKTDQGRWGTGTWLAGSKGHGWGILFSAGLLSLGAPFWYNTLKNLTSLRSTVAQNISKEREQEQKKTDEGKPPQPPPTVVPPH